MRHLLVARLIHAPASNSVTTVPGNRERAGIALLRTPIDGVVGVRNIGVAIRVRGAQGDGHSSAIPPVAARRTGQRGSRRWSAGVGNDRPYGNTGRIVVGIEAALE